jgi:hypothetical protein
MFCVHIAGDKLGVLAYNLRKNLLVALINESHVNQLDDAPTFVGIIMSFSPNRPQVISPLTN